MFGLASAAEQSANVVPLGDYDKLYTMAEAMCAAADAEFNVSSITMVGFFLGALRRLSAADARGELLHTGVDLRDEARWAGRAVRCDGLLRIHAQGTGQQQALQVPGVCARPHLVQPTTHTACPVPRPADP